MKELMQLYWAFFRIGGLTFGGGLTMLPMLKYELVEKKKWIDEDTLLECYAIGQCTPGIIAVNTATFVGYRRRGVWGGIFSTLGMITPSLVIITTIALVLQNFMDYAVVQHALVGIRGAVCALMMNTVINLGKKSLNKVVTWVLCIGMFALAWLTDIPTIALVLAAALVGIIYNKFPGGMMHHD
ncbi:MAG: chromate transporter [Eubacterium sp.]|nr:chromate transporter [Candidatus Colimonas fimequi]